LRSVEEKPTARGRLNRFLNQEKQRAMSYPNLSRIQIRVLELLSRGENLTRWQIKTRTGIRVRSLRDSIRRLSSRQLITAMYQEGNFKYQVTRDGLNALDFYKRQGKLKTRMK